MSEDKISLPVEDQRLLDKALLRSTQYVYDIPPAPAAMPSVEEIKDLLLRFHADTASAWRHERDGIATSAARAILALFAPILAEKERDGVMLAAEAIRAHMIGADPNLILGMDRSVDVILKLAAAIRAQGE
jgi:hypothetical protein